MNEEVLFASTTPGLEPALLREVQALTPRATAVEGGVELQGPAGLHQAANLQLRTASRVLLRVAELSLRAAGLSTLEQGLRAAPLARYLDPSQGPVTLVVHAKGTRLGPPEVLRQAAGRALGLTLSSTTATPPGPELLLRVSGPQATLSIDTSGELLYRRGYRQEVSRAPLRETLAAGALLLAGYDGSEPLLDPMCGSGTFGIEAALLAVRRAPGADRSFAFERFPSFDAAAYAALKAQTHALPKPAAPIVLTDLNAGSLGTARRNARRAGVLEHLTLDRKDALTLAPPAGKPGLVITNMPYGKRVHERSEVKGLIAGFCDHLRAAFTGWRVALLTLEEDAASVKLPGKTTHAVDNGGLRCALTVAAVPSA